MAHELPYHAQLPFTFGALEQDAASFDRARAVVLPVPFERTTSYVPGTKNGPREIIAASGQVELYDEELGREMCDIGIHTLPAMESPFASTDEAFAEMRRVAAWLAGAGKFFVALGGEHALTAPLVAGVADVHPGVTVLQIDAHADLRESYMGDRHSHASAMRRVLEHAPAVQVAIRNLSAPEAEAFPGSTPRCSTTGTCATIRRGSRGSSRRWARRSTSPSTATASTRRSCRRSARRSPAG